MVGLKINMPETCECCPCNDDSFRCGATGEEFDFDPCTRKSRNCPLIDLTQYEDDGK